MRSIATVLIILAYFFITSCEKENVNFPKGYDHIYYAFFDYIIDDLGNVNSRNLAIDIPRNSADSTQLGIKFMSNYLRDYDVDVKLYVKQSEDFLNQQGIKTAPPLAIPGIDFMLSDESGKVLTPIKEGELTYYSIRFENARKGIQNVYIKMLNNQDDPSDKSVWVSFASEIVDQVTSEEEFMNTAMNNKQEEYTVLTRGQSYWRRINIK